MTSPGRDSIGDFFVTLGLSVVFVFFVCPAAFVLRLLGKAPLDIQPERSRSSYWIRKVERRTAADFFRSPR